MYGNRWPCSILCVTMSNMKTTSVREVQHNLNKILRWVEDGEAVAITRHKRVVANLVPSSPKQPTGWPDFTKRMNSIWGKAARGKPASEVIIEERTDRPWYGLSGLQRHNQTLHTRGREPPCRRLCTRFEGTLAFFTSSWDRGEKRMSPQTVP